MACLIYSEYIYSIAIYQKYLKKYLLVERIDNFRALARKLSFFSTELDIFDVRQHYVCRSILFIFRRLMSFIISNTTNINLAVYEN